MKKMFKVFLCAVVAIVVAITSVSAAPSRPPHTPLMGINAFTGEEIPIEVELGDVFYSEGQKHRVLHVWPDGSFATEVISESDYALPCRARCPQCSYGYISSSDTAGLWIDEGPTTCQHGEMGTDDKQYRKITTTTSCDTRCGFGRTIDSSQNRVICRGY